MTLQERLDEAEKAYHDLMTGQMVRVAVDRNGERVEYNSATAARLASYIQELKDQISGASTRGPLNVYFG